MKNLVLTLLILVTGIFIFQCADSDDDDEPEYNQADDDDDNILDDIEVNWETCSLFEGQDDGRAECAFVEMPFDWIQLDERTFTVAAKRLLSKSEKSDGQMWLLQGGPGASGTIELTWAMEIFQELYPELDFYTLDARGTGYSEFAECPEQQAESSSNGIAIDITEVDDCIAYLDGTYGDELAVFNPTNAAHDLAALIYHTRTEDGKVLVWGGSGGTFWGQRYLQLFPNQIDGIVLEAIVPAVFSLVFQDEFSEKVADSLFKLCIGDSFCSARIVDPFVFLRDLYVKLDMGHCPSMGLSSYGLRTILDAMLGGWPQRDMIPALIYRIDRCDEEDVEAVFSFYDVIFGSGSKGQDNSFSYVLHYNEVFSELWEHPLFADNQQLLEYLDKVYLYPLIGYEKGYDRNELYLKWPKYDAPLDDIWAQTDIPMLMLQGQMDPVTPYESAKTMTSHFAGKHQTFVTFPYATHNVISGTPMDKPIESEHCAKNIFDQFIHDPEAALDTDCVDDAIPPDFEGQPWAPYVFGTQDYWENVPVKSGEMPSEVRDTLTESARRMNEMLRQKGFERRFDQPQR